MCMSVFACVCVCVSSQTPDCVCTEHQTSLKSHQPTYKLQYNKEANKQEGTIGWRPTQPCSATLVHNHSYTHFVRHSVCYCIWWGHGVDGPIAGGQIEREMDCPLDRCVNVCRARRAERKRDVFEKTNQYTHVFPIRLPLHVWHPPASHFFHVSLLSYSLTTGAVVTLDFFFFF